VMKLQHLGHLSFSTSNDYDETTNTSSKGVGSE